jgi:L-alanine-DL-glutamate epimerase-like enolase superfamily enzyme
MSDENRITSIETYTTKMVGLVRVRTTDGREGWGQTSTFNAHITAQVLHEQVAPVVIGSDPDDIPGFVEAAIEQTYKFPGSYNCRAITGIETALWDLKGKSEGKNVCTLLAESYGRRPKDAVAAYGSSMSRTISPKDEAERVTRLQGERGFGAFKVRIGSVNGHDRDMYPGRSEELVKTVTGTLGDRAQLFVDGNSCYTAPKAIEVGRMLEAHGVRHFEEPCPYWQYDWTREVTAALDVPVAGGEQDNYMPAWERMIREHVVDIVQPDVCYIGGVSRAKHVADMAAEAGRPCTPHSANLSMVTLFTAHLLGAIPNAGPFMEFSIEHSPWTEGLYEPRLEVKDGLVAIPPDPGWGVRVNPEWLGRAEYRATLL